MTQHKPKTFLGGNRIIEKKKTFRREKIFESF